MLLKSLLLSTLTALVLVNHALPASTQTEITLDEARAIAKDAYI